MDVEIVNEPELPPRLRVRTTHEEATASIRDHDSAAQELAGQLVALGYPEWVRDCARSFRDQGDAALVFELACQHEGTVSAVRAVGNHGAYVECTRCACRLYDAEDDVWRSPPRHGWAREARKSS